jgi:hypothetical protein
MLHLPGAFLCRLRISPLPLFEGVPDVGVDRDGSLQPEGRPKKKRSSFWTDLVEANPCSEVSRNGSTQI